MSSTVIYLSLQYKKKKQIQQKQDSDKHKKQKFDLNRKLDNFFTKNYILSQKSLILQLNAKAFIKLSYLHIKINIILSQNGMPKTIKHKSAQLLVIRYINALNPIIKRTGSICLKPQSGELTYTINTIFQQRQYDIIIKNKDYSKINRIIEEVQSVCDCVKNYIIIIYVIAGLIDASNIKNLMTKNEQINRVVDLQVKFHDLISKISRINLFQYSFMYRDQLKKNSSILKTEHEQKINSSRKHYNEYADFRSKNKKKFSSILSNYSVIESDFQFTQYQQQWIKQHYAAFIKYLTQINQNTKLMRQIKINLDEFKKRQVIKQFGNNSKLFLLKINQSTQNTSTNHQQKMLAIKQTVLLTKINHQKQILSKIKDQSCNNIVKYYQTKQKQLEYALIMDYHTYTLSSYKTNHMMTMSLPNKIFLICQVIQGLRFLRDNKIVHLDMKSDNVLLSKGLTVKVTDFGQSYHPDICDKKFQPGFSFPYASPQLFYKKPTYDQKSDVYNLGVMMYELFFLKYPIQIRQKSHAQLENYYQSMQNSKYKLNDRIVINQDDCGSFGPQILMQSLSNLCLKCMSVDKNDRPYLDWILIQLRESLNYIAQKQQIHSSQ